MTALPDVRTLNKAKELGLKAWAKDISPALMVMHDSVLGQINTAPNKIITVLQEGAIVPLKSGSSYDVTQWKEADLRDSIRKEFFADQLVLPPFQGTPMTATEVQVRVEQFQRILGPTMGRIKSECNRPIISNAYKMRARAGGFDEMPALLKQYQVDNNESPLDVEFTGPLARAQKMSEVAAYEQFMARIIVPIGQINPAVFDKINTDNIVDFGADRLGLPSILLNDQSKVTAIRTARAQMQQQQMQQAQQAQQAEQMAKMGPALQSMREEPI